MLPSDPAPDAPLDLASLARLADVSARTVRYYVQAGLLPAPVGRGPGAYWTTAHLDRLRLIRAWQERHQPLAEIRAALERLDDAAVRATLAELRPRPTAPGTTALEYVRAVLGGAAAPAVSPTAPPPPAPAPLRAAMPAAAWPRERTPREGAPSRADDVPREAGDARDASVAPLHDDPRVAREQPLDPLDLVALRLEEATRPAAIAADQLALSPRPTRATWERHTLAADVELHIRRPLTRDQQRRVDQLLDYAAQLFREDA